MKRSILLLSALASLSVWAPQALAEDVEEAKRHFSKAETAYNLGNFQTAIQEYEAAYKAMPAPAFLFNIAQAHRQQFNLDKKVFHLQKALTLYKTYLRESEKAQNRRTVKTLIEELRQLLSAVETQTSDINKQDSGKGILALHGKSAVGGRITLDGKPWGVMPRTGEVAAGTHQVRVTRKGYTAWSTSVVVKDKAKVEIPIRLMPLESGVASRAPGQSKPVYKKWWFWTLIAGGAAAAGGAAVGIYYGTRGDEAPTMPEINLR